MPEINPDNIDNHRPQKPEELATLEQARKRVEEMEGAKELLKSKEEEAQAPKSSFQAYPDSGQSEKVDQIIGQPVEVNLGTIETESGLSQQEQEDLKKDPLAWINRAIGDKKLSPNEAMQGLIEAQDQQNNDLKKAA